MSSPEFTQGPPPADRVGKFIVMRSGGKDLRIRLWSEDLGDGWPTGVLWRDGTESDTDIEFRRFQAWTAVSP